MAVDPDDLHIVAATMFREQFTDEERAWLVDQFDQLEPIEALDLLRQFAEDIAP